MSKEPESYWCSGCGELKCKCWCDDICPTCGKLAIQCMRDSEDGWCPKDTNPVTLALKQREIEQEKGKM